MATGAWLHYAARSHPELHRGLDAKIRRRRDFPLVMDHLDRTTCDSQIELFVYLHALADGAELFGQSPSRLRFESHPVVHFDSDHVLGGRPMTGYLLRRDGFSVALIPQVTLLAGRRYTIDALGIALRGRRRVDFVFEVDGEGHDSRYDRERRKALRLPEVRVTQAQVLDSGFLEVFWNAVGQLFAPHGPRRKPGRLDARES